MQPAAGGRRDCEEAVPLAEHAGECVAFKRRVFRLRVDVQLGVGPRGLNHFEECQALIVKRREDSDLADRFILQPALYVRPEWPAMRMKQLDRKPVFQLDAIREPGWSPWA
jgi:hypothetical protein